MLPSPHRKYDIIWGFTVFRRPPRLFGSALAMESEKRKVGWEPWTTDKTKTHIAVTETTYDSDYTPTTPGRASRASSEKDGERASPSLEKPKIAVSGRRRDALYYGVVYHLPALLVTAFLTIIYVQQWRWPYPGPSDEVQAGLQFVAKLHECLLILSLSNILFHRLRYLLLTSEGVPLGLLTTAFQLNNPMFFIGPEFLGTLRQLFSSLSIFLTFGLACSIALLSFAASPLSAVVLLPRPLRLPLPESHFAMQALVEKKRISGSPDAEGYYLRDTLPIPAASFYPTSIGPELGVTWNCPSLPNRPGNCVSFFQKTFPEILINSLTSTSRNSGNSPMVPDPAGILIDGGSRSAVSIGAFHFPVELALTAPPAYDTIIRVTTSLQTSITSLVAIRGAIMGAIFPGDGTERADYPLITTNKLHAEVGVTNSVPQLQPQILAQMCDRGIEFEKLSVEYLTSFAWSVKDEDPGLVYPLCFGTGLFPEFNFTMSEQLAMMLLEQDWELGFLLFVDLQDHVPFPISGGYISVEPRMQTEIALNQAVPERQRVRIGFFLAQWAEASATYISSVDSNGLATPDVRPGELARPLIDHLNMSASTVGPLVRMDAVWLNSLDIFPFEILPTGGFPRLNNNSRSLFDHVAASSVEIIPIFLSAVMSTAQGMYGIIPAESVMCVVPGTEACIFPDGNGTSAIQYTYSRALPVTDAELPENQVQVRVKIEQEVWGYAFQGTTIIGAFVFLYLHAALVLVHLAIMAVGGWSSMAWASLSDFVVLGLNSASSRLLEHAGTGVSAWKTWGFMASVRNVKREGRLELVVCDPERDEYAGLLGRERVKKDLHYS